MIRVRDVVTHLKTFAYPEKPGSESIFSLDEVFRSAKKIVAKELEGVQVEVDLPEVLVVRGQKTQIMHLFINLLSNAGKALKELTAPGPKVIWVRGKVSEEMASIEVADNGPGIPENILNRVFEPFFTTREVGSGMGMGLSICHTIVESHHRRVTPRKHPRGQPARGGRPFHHQPTTGRTGTQMMLNQDSNRRCTILYIDDEEKALKYFKWTYQEHYQIFTAPSGKEGLELLRREAGTIDIIMSDQRMPGMKGTEVLEIVRREFPSIVRILTTAYSDLAEAIEAVNNGHIFQYVTKPWEEGPDLKMILRLAADYSYVLRERDELLALKMTTLQRIVCSDRLKWLLLACRSRSRNEQSAFRRALIAFIRALPDVIGPSGVAKKKFGVRDFDIGFLVRSEYDNAVRCLDSIHSDETPLEPVARLEALRAGFIEHYGLAPGQVGLMGDSATGFELSVRPELTQFVPAAFSKVLFGLLIEWETSILSLRLFEALFAVALGGRSLAVAVEPPAGNAVKFSFTMPLDCPDSPEEVISNLYEKFSSWDIASL